MSAKFFIGPMSKNIVDSIVEFTNTENIEIGLIPSRRQVEFSGGYVNNWTTKDFCEYVRTKTKKIKLVRDHCGPSQGTFDDDGIESFIEDCKYFDVVHLDVWKKNQNYEEGLKSTIDFLKLGFSLNESLYYEIGTEESIRPFETTELDNLILDLKKTLPEKLFSRIKYLVIQSGTALKQSSNIGKYNSNRLVDMVSVANKYNLICKEHNGDYLQDEVIIDKFSKGLECINIAPEFGRIETKTLIEHFNTLQNDHFFEICYKSNKWVKWVSNDFDPYQNKKELIEICGHYVLSNQDFMELKKQLNFDIDLLIKENIKKKLYNLISLTQK